MVHQRAFEVEFEWNGSDYEVIGKGKPGHGGSFGGPPDRATPPEPSDWMIGAVTRISIIDGVRCVEPRDVTAFCAELMDDDDAMERLNVAIDDALAQDTENDALADRAYDAWQDGDDSDRLYDDHHGGE